MSDLYKKITSELLTKGLDAYNIDFDFIIEDDNKRKEMGNLPDVRDAFLDFKSVEIYLHPEHPSEYGLVVLKVLPIGYLKGKQVKLLKEPIQLSGLCDISSILANNNNDTQLAKEIFTKELGSYLYKSIDTNYNLRTYKGVEVHGIDFDPPIFEKKLSMLIIDAFNKGIQENLEKVLKEITTLDLNGSYYTTFNKLEVKLEFKKEEERAYSKKTDYKWVAKGILNLKNLKEELNVPFKFVIPLQYNNPTSAKFINMELQKYVLSGELSKLTTAKYKLIFKDMPKIPEEWQKIVSKENYDRVVYSLKLLESQKMIQLVKSEDGLVTVKYANEIVLCGSEGFFYPSDLKGYCRGDDRKEALKSISNHPVNLNKLLIDMYDFRKKIIIEDIKVGGKNG